MRKALIAIFITFSLLAPPISHASGVAGDVDKCHMSEQADSDSTSDTQEEGTSAKADHHCCCSHASLMSDLLTHEHVFSTSKAIAFGKGVHMTSVVLGPPLKPPSHA